MGTPEFATPSLHALLAAATEQHWQVVAVATQPDRPAGRSKTPVSSPVKQVALAAGVPVLQPASLRKEPDAVEAIRLLAPDVIVVAAYGLILPKSVLEIPTFGCINVHASLLPAYRGASPITATLLDGREETGVTIMLMDEGMDTGPALRQVHQGQGPQRVRSQDRARRRRSGRRLDVTGATQLLQLVGELRVPGGHLMARQFPGGTEQLASQRPIGLAHVGHLTRLGRVQAPHQRLPVDVRYESDPAHHHCFAGVHRVGVELRGTTQTHRIAGHGERQPCPPSAVAS